MKRGKPKIRRRVNEAGEIKIGNYKETRTSERKRM